MKSVTLISDWKLKDPYVAIFKAQLATKVAGIQQFDISHAIDLFNIEQTAFLLKNSYKSFPQHTLHIILTNAPMDRNTCPVLVEYDKHYFLGQDNGIFSMMFGNTEPLKALQYHPSLIDSNSYTDKILEMVRWFFTDQIEDNTTPYSKFKLGIKHEATYDAAQSKIQGHIIYIDAVCNAITNIPVEMFEEANTRNQFEATLSSASYLNINKCYDYYNPAGREAFFVRNSMGYLEIAMYRNNFAVLSDIKVGDIVEIRF